MTTAAQRAAYQYSYTEPHPSVSKATNLSTGRGGRGNATKLCPQTTTQGPTATGPPARSPLSSPSLGARRFSTGRGGAGNVKDKSQVATISEPTVYELERDARHDHEDAIGKDKRVWHYGRGGEGNLINQKKGDNVSVKSIKSEKGKQRAGALAGILGSGERRGSNESVISSGSSVAGEERSKTSRAGSFADKFAAKLGARKNSKGSAQ